MAQIGGYGDNLACIGATSRNHSSYLLYSVNGGLYKFIDELLLWTVNGIYIVVNLMKSILSYYFCENGYYIIVKINF